MLGLTGLRRNELFPLLLRHGAVRSDHVPNPQTPPSVVVARSNPGVSLAVRSLFLQGTPARHSCHDRNLPRDSDDTRSGAKCWFRLPRAGTVEPYSNGRGSGGKWEVGSANHHSKLCQQNMSRHFDKERQGEDGHCECMQFAVRTLRKSEGCRTSYVGGCRP